MNIDIITEQPLWYSILCLALGAAGALLLYFRDTRFDQAGPWLIRLMAFLRFAALSILAFLLLGPLIRTLSRTVEKPIMVLAQDNSESIRQGSGNEFLEKTYKPDFNRLVESLKGKYEVRTLTFGDGVSDELQLDFNDKVSDFTSLFDELRVKYANRNLAGVIIASDGLYNQGSSPLYAMDKIRSPVYTIAMGDTTIRKDVIVSRVNHNKLAFLGNSFPLEIVLDARQCAGNRTQLTVTKDSVVLISRSVDIPGNRYHQNIPVFLDAKEKGMQHFRISLSFVDGEINRQNNFADIFIEVAESKQKVLILAHSPHPDLAALKNVLETSQNYEVHSKLAKDLTENLNDYHLVILHQVPSAESASGPLFEKLLNTDASLLFILGSQTSVSAFNKMESGITISDHNGKTNESQARLEPNFSLFSLSEDLTKNFHDYPPVVTPFGNYKNTGDNNTLFYQQIGNVTTTLPLLVFNSGGRHKNAVFCGENFWKWRLHEYAETNKQVVTDEIFLKTVQYLSVKEKKSPLRILHKSHYAENEPLIFDAELYNESHELINAPDVRLTIYTGKKAAYPFTFSKTDKAYTLNAGFFPVGNYRFRADVKLGDKSYSDAGEFSISALQLEQAETRADHQILFALSRKTGGTMVYPDAMQDLIKILENREDIKPVIYTGKKLQDIVNLKWVFYLLMFLLSAEWFMRKRSGAY